MKYEMLLKLPDGTLVTAKPEAMILHEPVPFAIPFDPKLYPIYGLKYKEEIQAEMAKVYETSKFV